MKFVVAMVGLLLGLSGAEARCSLKALFYGQVDLKIETHDVDGSPGLQYETGVLVRGAAPGTVIGRMDEPVRDGVYPLSNAAGESCGELSANLAMRGGDLPLRFRKVDATTFSVLNGKAVVGTVKGRLPREASEVSNPSASRPEK